MVLNLRAPSLLLGFQLGGIVGHKFLSNYRVAMDMERASCGSRSFSAPGSGLQAPADEGQEMAR